MLTKGARYKNFAQSLVGLIGAISMLCKETQVALLICTGLNAIFSPGSNNEQIVPRLITIEGPSAAMIWYAGAMTDDCMIAIV